MTATATRYERVETRRSSGWLSSSALSGQELVWREYATRHESVSYSDLWKRQLAIELLEGCNPTGPLANAGAANYAVAFLDQLPSDAPVPAMVIEDDGDIAFDWDVSARNTFSVSVSRDGTLRYGGLFGHRTRYGKDQLTSAIPQVILSGIAETVARKTL